MAKDEKQKKLQALEKAAATVWDAMEYVRCRLGLRTKAERQARDILGAAWQEIRAEIFMEQEKDRKRAAAAGTGA